MQIFFKSSQNHDQGEIECLMYIVSLLSEGMIRVNYIRHTAYVAYYSFGFVVEVVWVLSQ